MDDQTSWQAFACTGNIYRYLDYKQHKEAPPPADAVKEAQDGRICDAGPCSERDPL